MLLYLDNISGWDMLSSGCDDRERRVSSWGIRMELIWTALGAPCHQEEGSLHLAHVDGLPCDIAHSTRGGILSDRFSTFSRYLISEILVRRHFTFSGYLTSKWERRMFQLPRSDMSGFSDSAYLESIRSRQFRFLRQLGSSDTRDSSDPFPSTIKKQTLIILTTKSPFCIVQQNFS